MPYAQATDGTRIHYRVLGDHGVPLVMLQGLSLSGRFWFDLPEELSAEHRVLVIDNRGTGRSGDVDSPFRIATMADDVLAVLDAEHVDAAVICGISMGGMIAQEVALRHPERTRGLVLLATTPGLPHGRLPKPDALAALVQLPFLRNTERGGRLSAGLLLPRHALPKARELFAKWPAAFASDPNRPRSFFLQLGAILRHSTGARLGTLKCPVYVVAGDEDVLVPWQASRAIADLVPHARWELLEGVGHAIPTIDREAVRRGVAHVLSAAA